MFVQMLNGNKMVLLLLEEMDKAMESINSHTHAVCMLMMIKMSMSLIRLNHRIVKWKSGATSGQMVVGGNQQGSGAHQLYNPSDVIIDKERDNLIICDYSNRRVIRWPCQNGTSGEIIISNINCSEFNNG